MKTLQTTLITLLFIFTATSLSAQTIYVVDNTSGAPEGDHVFTEVQDAIDAASSGDIIHIMPSTTSYFNFTLDKSLNLYGIGYNPDKQAPITTRINIITVTADASGSVISGFNVGRITLEGNPQNDPIVGLLVDKNNLNSINTSNNPHINQLLIQKNIIGSSNNSSINLPTGPEVSNVIISNNIFAGDDINSSGHIRAGNQTVITQNLFLGDGNNRVFANLQNSQVQNNIFLGARPVVSSTGIQFTTFENNLLFGVNEPEFPVGENGNTGSNNLVGVDPLFVNLEPSNSDWDFNWDASFQDGSPAIGAGLNGVDLGIFGGAAPFDLTMVPLPLIQAFNVPGFIGTGDELNVTIQARSNEN